MSVETLLFEMNAQNVVHMDARNGNRTEIILQYERELLKHDLKEYRYKSQYAYRVINRRVMKEVA